ncbi:uncharacterized protein [Littorina saxatilis]|uniref:Uncharacterized protein n=1 Tax=Littorina saxatilis TaxID=31220 RepID=A0AAN9BC73_9CAEN
MRALFVAIFVCFQLSVVLATTAAPNTCSAGCTCSDEESDVSSVTKQEGLAAAVGAMTPLVVGGAGLGLYKLLKGAGSSLSGPHGPPEMSSPRGLPKRDSIPSFKGSPSSHHGMRRGSTPVSMFGEDDDLSFDESWKGGRPDTTSIYTNIHRPSKADGVNRWL